MCHVKHFIAELVLLNRLESVGHLNDIVILCQISKDVFDTDSQAAMCRCDF